MNPPLHQLLSSRLVGGAAVIAIRLSAAAAHRGFECSAWVPGDGPAADALDRATVRTRHYDFEGLRGSRLDHLVACARMVPGLAGWHRPIVHVHNPTVFGLVRPALGSVRARAVVHFHSEPSLEEIAWTLKSPPEHIVTCAKHIATTVREHTSQLARPVAVTTVPNAVDTERFTPGDPAEARARLGVSTDRFVVIMVANLAPNKGQMTALQAIAELIRRGVAVECWLVGEDRATDREYEKQLRAFATDQHLDGHVQFLGFRHDAPDLLRAADAFVLPSSQEGLPLSVLEAQAARVPVVGSDIPGIREVVEDGKTGFIVPAGDPVGYADRLQTLFQDRQRRRQVTDEAAAQVARDHQWASFEERMFAVYERMLTATPARSG